MFQASYIQRIAALVGVAAICALGAYAYTTVRQSDLAVRPPVSINVTGKGEVYAKPDIAEFSFSVDTKEADVATAQTKSATAINAAIAYLKDKGVEEKDIKTQDYNISQWYEYPQVICLGGSCPGGERKLKGYEVTQTVSVKVRKVDTAGQLISGVGGLGATNMSGLSFTIDDQDAVSAQAREKAIADAKVKAVKLAQDLGVRLVRMTGYSENGNWPMAYNVGSGMKAMATADSAVAPEMPTGQNLVTSQVTLSFEVR